MSLRTDKFSGIVTCVLGVVITEVACLGLIMSAAQLAIASAAPPRPQGPNHIAFADAIHSLWLTYFPILIIGGIVYFIVGLCLWRGSPVARRVAQANTVCVYAWLIAYAFSCYRMMETMGPAFNWLPASVLAVIQWLSIVFWILIGTVFLIGMLYILSRPRQQQVHFLLVLPLMTIAAVNPANAIAGGVLTSGREPLKLSGKSGRQPVRHSPTFSNWRTPMASPGTSSDWQRQLVRRWSASRLDDANVECCRRRKNGDLSLFSHQLTWWHGPRQ